MSLQVCPDVSLEFVYDGSVLGDLGPLIRIGQGLESYKGIPRKPEIIEKASKPTVAQRESQDALAMAGKIIEDQGQRLRHRDHPTSGSVGA